MSEPVIRAAAPGDLAAILAISNWAALHTAANFATEPETDAEWQESWEQTHEMFPWLVAEGAGGAGGEVVGFAKASPWKGRCAYHWTAETTVYVHPDHHGRGIGRALYARLIETLAAQGYRMLLGGITVPNPASVGLHESMGFRRVALLPRVGWKFGRWHDVGYWALHLGAPDAPPAAIRPVAEACASCQSQ